MWLMTMAPNGTTSIVHACCKGLNETHLTSAISFEVRSGCRNMYYRTMRFSNFLHSKLSKWCSPSNQFCTEKLLEESSGYSTANISERSKFLNKVSVLMGYGSIKDLIEQEKMQKESSVDTDGMVENFDFTLALSRFPCITLGDSSVIELYNEVPGQQQRMNPLIPESYKNYLPFSIGGNWTEANGIGGALQFIGDPVSNLCAPTLSSSSSYMLLYDSQVENINSETKSDAPVNCKKSLTAGCINSLDTTKVTEPILDKTVRCLSKVSRRQCSQLEDSGFPTVRKLLHHFPRTYADLQNPQGAIEDGQYLICVGTVLSSRFSQFSVEMAIVLAVMDPQKD